MAIPGATASTLTLAAVTVADSGSYTVTVSNTLGSVTSSAASLTVTVTTPVSLTAQPQPLTVAAGQTATFTVAATGTGPLTYQWYKAGVAIPGTTASTLTLAAVTGADAGSYTVTVGNALGSVTSSAANLTITAASFSILTQPQSQTVAPPDSVTFTVVASGSGLTYVWKKNGAAIAGAGSASYTVPSTEFAYNNDAYTVTVSDGTSSLTSNPVAAIAQLTRVTYAGDPLPVPARPVTVLPSYTYNANFPNGAFRLGYDESLKDPVWSCFVDFPVKTPYANSSGDYQADPRLVTPRVGKTDYNGLYTSDLKGYDRGHMAMRSEISYRYGPTAGDDATIMSNLVPQISNFNQQAWLQLETSVGGSNGGTSNGLTAFLKRIWVYTGSVFPANPTFWTSSVQPTLKIAIPVACWKIIVTEPSPGLPKVLAVLMPNIYGLLNSASAATSYITSVKRIEELTGLDFFPNLAAVAPTMDAGAIAAWKANVDARGWRVPFEQASGPNVHVIQPSYDITVDHGTDVTFEAAATSTASTIASTTWNFGDASAPVTGLNAVHNYAVTGTFSISFSAKDGLGSINTLTRVIKVK